VFTLKSVKGIGGRWIWIGFEVRMWGNKLTALALALPNLPVLLVPESWFVSLVACTI
jgi:hypothetical protein